MHCEVSRKNQVSIGTQTDFPICNDCELKRYVTYFSFKSDAEQRKIVYDGVMEMDAETGEVLGYDVDYSRHLQWLSHHKYDSGGS